jgi:hypothetical protein
VSDELSEVPAPVLFNPWKHHAGALRQRIAATIQAGAPALAELAAQLVVVGAELMDLYTGPLSPADIASRVLATLAADGRLEANAYADWLAAGGGYRVLTIAADGSRWVLRLGETAGRYVHVHPGRWTPQTRRVKANVLKTAALALAFAGIHGGDPHEVDLVNTVRRQYLGLPPLKALAGAHGLGGVIDLLRG